MTSLVKNKPATPETVDVPASAPTESTVAVVTQSPSTYTASSDIIRPSLKLVHPLSPLSENFPEASIVLNKESMLSDGTVPIKITVVDKKRFYREKVEFESGIKAKLLYSEEELRAAGGTTDWINDNPPTYEDVLATVIAIESDKPDPNLPFEFGGKHYGIAEWELHGKAFKLAGRLIQTAASWSLKDGLINGSWALTTKREKLKKGVAINPILKAGPRNSPEVVAFLKELTTG